MIYNVWKFITFDLPNNLYNPDISDTRAIKFCQAAGNILTIKCKKGVTVY